MSVLFQRESLNWWPMGNVTYYDGWFLKYGHGYSRYANAVHPLYQSELKLSDKLSYCEEWFHSHKIPPLFLVTPDRAQEVDSFLQKASYTKEDLTKILIYPHLSQLKAMKSNKTIFCGNHFELLARSTIFQSFSKEHQQRFWKIVYQNRENALFLLIKEGEKTLATGFAIVEGNSLVLYDITVALQERSKGYGTLLVNRLLWEGKKRGCKEAYLHVTADNKRASALYSKMGFIELHQFWYRTK